MHFTMASIHPVGIGANAVRKIPQLQPQRIPQRISTRLRAENGNSGNDDTAPSPSSPSSSPSSSDDLIARLKAAEEEAKELKQKLDAVNATTSGAATEPAAAEPAKPANRIDGADLRRETLSFVDDKPRNWLSESDIEFFTGGGASCCHRIFLVVALLLDLLSLSLSRHSSPGPSELEEDGSAVRTSKERRSASASTSIDAHRSRRNPSSFEFIRVHSSSFALARSFTPTVGFDVAGRLIRLGRAAALDYRRGPVGCAGRVCVGPHGAAAARAVQAALLLPGAAAAGAVRSLID